MFLGIYHQLGMRNDAIKVFTQGEQAFFQVLGHMLSSHSLKLGQCPATIVPMRQLVLSEVSILNDQELFADVISRWKCLFRELRSQLISCNISNGFGDFFQWYRGNKHQWWKIKRQKVLFLNNCKMKKNCCRILPSQLCSK